MDNGLRFDYYYGMEAEQHSFYRVPRLLVKDKRFKKLSSDAKLLYGLMLDRMSLSVKNGWFDDENRAYIYYTVENIMEDLGCSKPTCSKIMAELDEKKGIGLIERKKQGLGKPDMIYVKNFVLSEEEPESEMERESPENAVSSAEVKKVCFQKEKELTSEGKETELQEVKEVDSQRLKIFTSGGKETELQEVKEFDSRRLKIFTSEGKETELQEVKEVNSNYNNNNYTDLSYNNPIHLSERERGDKVDGTDDMNVYIEIIKENVEYEHYMKQSPYQDKVLYEELFELICEVVCVKRKTVKIGGEDYPYELVKAKFLKLNSSHLEYVIGCMKKNTAKITNIKAYMITTLYNAPSTINHYYQQEVQHDLYGGGFYEANDM